MIDEWNREEVELLSDAPYLLDPRAYGEKVDPVESHREAQKRYKARRQGDDPDYGKNSPEYMRKYMRQYRAKLKEQKSQK